MVSVAARLNIEYPAEEESVVIEALTTWTVITLILWVGGEVPPIVVKGRRADGFHEEDPFPLGPFVSRTLIDDRRQYVCDIVQLPTALDGDSVNRCLLCTLTPVELVSNQGPEAGQEADGKSEAGTGGGASPTTRTRDHQSRGVQGNASEKSAASASVRPSGGESVRKLDPEEATALVEEVAACFGPERDRVEGMLVMLRSALTSYLICYMTPTLPSMKLGKRTLARVQGEMAFDTDGEVIGFVIELPPAPGGNRKERRLIIYQ